MATKPYPKKLQTSNLYRSVAVLIHLSLRHCGSQCAYSFLARFTIALLKQETDPTKQILSSIRCLYFVVRYAYKKVVAIIKYA